ncbi:MAG: hypothetical protein JOZ35_14310 [Hyphomicrobiales bacterium]|nr:hypothetical protein [Hyphomicrobiales bacterium]
MTMNVRTQSRWRFKRQPATHNFFIHFVRRADRVQYYDCTGLCSAGRGLRELSAALKICWTLPAPSNRIGGEIAHGGYRGAVPYSGRTIVPNAMVYALQMRAGD